MELNEIIEALKEKEVDSKVITAIKGLDQTGEISKLTKELEAEKGKHSGILEDKKKFKERAEAAEKTLKEQEDSKLSVEERVKNQIEELNQKIADAETAKAEQETQFKAKEREAALADITSSIKWSSSIPHDTAKLIVREGFKDVEVLEQSVVDTKVKELTEVHKAFISADAPGGSGGKSGHAGEPVKEGAATMKDLMDVVWINKFKEIENGNN
jgi:hypothetical protein